MATDKNSKIKEKSFVCIQGWMRTELGLKGNDLMIYAIIYGYSQGGEGVFRGSLQYLADWTGATKQGVMKNIKRLMELGLVSKTDVEIGKNLKFCEYRATEHKPTPSAEGVQLSLTGHATEFNGALNSVERGVKLSCTNNIEETIKDTIEDNINNTDGLPFGDGINHTSMELSIKRVMDAWNSMAVSVRETRGVKISTVSKISPTSARYADLVNLLKRGDQMESQLIASIKGVPRVDHWLRPTNPRMQGWVITFGWFLEHYDDSVIRQMEMRDILHPVIADGALTYEISAPTQTSTPAPAATAALGPQPVQRRKKLNSRGLWLGRYEVLRDGEWVTEPLGSA